MYVYRKASSTKQCFHRFMLKTMLNLFRKVYAAQVKLMLLEIGVGLALGMGVEAGRKLGAGCIVMFHFKKCSKLYYDNCTFL